MSKTGVKAHDDTVVAAEFDETGGDGGRRESSNRIGGICFVLSKRARELHQQWFGRRPTHCRHHESRQDGLGRKLMITLAPTLPSPVLTDEAMKLCASLLAIAADPAGTKSRLDELAAQTQALRDAIAQNETTIAKAAEVEAQQAAVAAREAAVADRERAVANAQTAVDVAGSANASRAQALNDREAELAKREQEHQARVKANEEKIAAVRASLA